MAVAALIGREHVEPGVGERLHLVSPRVGALGEPVAQHDERVARPSRFRDVELDAVGNRDSALTDLVHTTPSVRNGAASRSASSATRSSSASSPVGVGAAVEIGEDQRRALGRSARRAADRSSPSRRGTRAPAQAAATSATARRPGPDGNASNTASASTSGPRSERASATSSSDIGVGDQREPLAPQLGVPCVAPRHARRACGFALGLRRGRRPPSERLEQHQLDGDRRAATPASSRIPTCAPDPTDMRREPTNPGLCHRSGDRSRLR